MWLFKLFFSGDVHEDTRGEEFQQDFQQRSSALGLGLRIDFFTRTFHELCFEARRRKKPILIVTVQNNSDAAVRLAVETLSNDLVQAEINESFITYGMYSNHVDPNLERNMRFPRNAVISMWVLMVKPEDQVQITARLNNSGEEVISPQEILNFLHENMSLFNIMSEEDPEYQRIRILQDGKNKDLTLAAGVLPIVPGG